MGKRRNLGVAGGLLALAVASCSTPERPYCGEAFCLTEKPTSVTKMSPGKKFNLYRVEMAGSRFLIYEGDAPNTEGDRSFGPVPSIPKGFASGQLYGSERGYQILLKTGKFSGPDFIAVSLATRNPKDLDGLISKLEAK